MKRILLVAVSLLFVAPLAANATLIDLTFSGQVDGAGFTVGGVDAPDGSPFSLDITIDTANASIGEYAIKNISYTTTVGSYDTVSDWLVPLIATQDGPSISLAQQTIFEVNATTEHFLLNLTNFGPSLFDDPLTWSGTSITGDIIVRGIGGFASPDQLSGNHVFTGNLSVALRQVPEPGTLALLSIGFLGLGMAGRRRRKNSV